MKKVLFFTVGFLSIVCLTYGQQLDPVHWNISSKKIDTAHYELHFSANIQPGWHIYGTDNPLDLGLPTSVTFTNNPLFELSGKIEAPGVTAKTKKVAGLMIKYYSNRVDFVELITVKSDQKIIINGTINYMACTDTHCLPEAKKQFNIILNE